ncbi:MAG TPA: hypothetical protein VNO31_22300 [Umezawaea sp.]|nr:hypothetical protein [Umezawaea sp.]
MAVPSRSYQVLARSSSHWLPTRLPDEIVVAVPSGATSARVAMGFRSVPVVRATRLALIEPVIVAPRRSGSVV